MHVALLGSVLSSLVFVVARKRSSRAEPVRHATRPWGRTTWSGVTYTATLPNSDTTTIRGSISATASSNRTGVQFTVNFCGFPDPSLGPFREWQHDTALVHHIHDQPVPVNVSCKGTLAHLDSNQRGEHPACDPSRPQTCQVGDLAGKHGRITASPFSAQYVDFYASTKPGIGTFFGNRSIVIHTANATRLTGANFSRIPSSFDYGNDTATTTTTDGTSTSSGTGASATTHGDELHGRRRRSTTGTSRNCVLAMVGGLVLVAMLR
ncbi:MAG: hypothetical protein M1826_001363 [Phylliscum demangeonii]|nr:MAG: hypothetical protein M1826_001363 [Phylliscum demangeonii]